MAPRDQASDDGHVVPCSYARAIMWLFGMVVTIGVFVIGLMHGRMADLEQAAKADRERLVEIQTDLKYLRQDVAEIRSALRRGGSYSQQDR